MLAHPPARTAAVSVSTKVFKIEHLDMLRNGYKRAVPLCRQMAACDVPVPVSAENKQHLSATCA